MCLGVFGVWGLGLGSVGFSDHRIVLAILAI